jgi:transketolase
VLDLEPLVDKWVSFGFETREVNGHDVSALEELVRSLPFNKGKPSAVICHTVKGKGFGIAEHNSDWHHKSRLSNEEIDAMYDGLT